MNLIYRARVLMIELGKMLPFVLCGLVLISYIENIYALYNEDYLVLNNVVILNKRISYFIGEYFEYNVLHLFIVFVTSIAIQTCLTNKMACCYLALNLYEKSFFSNHIYDNEIYYIVSLINIALCGFFCYKGARILLK